MPELIRQDTLFKGVLAAPNNQLADDHDDDDAAEKLLALNDSIKQNSKKLNVAYAEKKDAKNRLGFFGSLIATLTRISTSLRRDMGLAEKAKRLINLKKHLGAVLTFLGTLKKATMIAPRLTKEKLRDSTKN